MLNFKDSLLYISMTLVNLTIYVILLVLLPGLPFAVYLYPIYNVELLVSIDFSLILLLWLVRHYRSLHDRKSGLLSKSDIVLRTAWRTLLISSTLLFYLVISGLFWRYIYSGGWP